MRVSHLNAATSAEADALTRQIAVLADAEPVLLSFDTSLQVADIWGRVDLAKAALVIRDIARRANLRSEIGAPTAVRIVEAIARLNKDDAERLALHLFEVSRDSTHRDAILDCALVETYKSDIKRAARFLELSLNAGGCCLRASPEVLRALEFTDEQRMRALATEIVARFPTNRASEWDTLMLLDCIRVIISRNNKLAEAALGKALEVAERIPPNSTLVTARYRRGLEIIDTMDTRSSLLFQIAGLTAGCCANQYQQHQSSFVPWKKALSDLTIFEAVHVTKPLRLTFYHGEIARWENEGQAKSLREAGARVATMSVADASRFLEKSVDVNIGVPAMLTLANRTGLTDENRRAVAIAALRKIPQMTDGINRLRTLEDEAKLLLQIGNYPLASESLSQLERSAMTYCGTNNISSQGEQQCEDSYTFLALRAWRGQLGSAGIRDSNNPSLRSRVLIQKLSQSLHAQ